MEAGRQAFFKHYPWLYGRDDCSECWVICHAHGLVLRTGDPGVRNMGSDADLWLPRRAVVPAVCPEALVAIYRAIRKTFKVVVHTYVGIWILPAEYAASDGSTPDDIFGCMFFTEISSRVSIKYVFSAFCNTTRITDGKRGF